MLFLGLKSEVLFTCNTCLIVVLNKTVMGFIYYSHVGAECALHMFVVNLDFIPSPIKQTIATFDVE